MLNSVFSYSILTYCENLIESNNIFEKKFVITSSILH